jgi:hypothetical protein
VVLRLSDEESALLREVLDAAISELSPEIADTDNAGYRRMLKERRDRLVAMREQLIVSAVLY